MVPFPPQPSNPAGVVRAAAHPLADRHDLAHVTTGLEDAALVLIGEATHGTHEFYATRARITQALIEQHGFTAVAIEGDWPHAYRVNRYVQGAGNDPDPAATLEGFERFPT